jgi:alpha-tubulin suppressor-like RCC1 family protein
MDVSGLTTGVTEIAAGAIHACAITSAGGAKCWGFNWAGQVGNGKTNSTFEGGPADVIGLDASVTSIAGAAWHTCAVADGGAKCFGDNYNGQIGDGSNAARSTSPVDVTGLTSGVAAVATGDYFSCALLDIGGVKCWGLNSVGQLGNGTNTDSGIPVDVSGLATGATAIAASDSGSFTDGWHTCVIVTGGGVKCWGLNDDGQLGNGTTTDSSVPVDVSGITGVTQITAGGGGHSCAITASGIKCWGANDQGQLGDGTTTNSSTPVDVKGL